MYFCLKKISIFAAQISGKIKVIYSNEKRHSSKKLPSRCFQRHVK
jgi:hypothetical protein